MMNAVVSCFFDTRDVYLPARSDGLFALGVTCYGKKDFSTFRAGRTSLSLVAGGSLVGSELSDPTVHL